MLFIIATHCSKKHENISYFVFYQILWVFGISNLETGKQCKAITSIISISIIYHRLKSEIKEQLLTTCFIIYNIYIFYTKSFFCLKILIFLFKSLDYVLYIKRLTFSGRKSMFHCCSFPLSGNSWILGVE